MLNRVGLFYCQQSSTSSLRWAFFMSGINMALSEKQRRFVDEYLIDLNATQAAIRAGYSEKTANEQGAQNLAKLSIKSEIEKRINDRKQRTEITQDKVLNDIELIKLDAMRTKIDANGNTEMLNHSAALKACELQGKHLAMFTDKQDVNLNGSLAITKIERIIVKATDTNA